MPRVRRPVLFGGLGRFIEIMLGRDSAARRGDGLLLLRQEFLSIENFAV